MKQIWQEWIWKNLIWKTVSPLAIRFTVVHLFGEFLSQLHIQTKVIVWQGTKTYNIKFVNYKNNYVNYKKTEGTNYWPQVKLSCSTLCDFDGQTVQMLVKTKI